MKLNPIYRRLLLILTCFVTYSSLDAQIRVAAMGGVQSTNFIQENSIPGFDTASGKYYSSNTGFELGVMAEIPLGNGNFYLQPGIKYSAKGNKFERFNDSLLFQSDTLYNQHTLNLNYVEMPFFLTWKIPFTKTKKSQFYLSAGPYFAFIFAASQSYQNRVLQYNSSKYIYKSGTEDLPVGDAVGAYKTFDIGVSAKAGFELGSVLIGAYYSRGLTNAYTAAYPSTFHNEVYGASLGIWLNKVKPPAPPVKDTDGDGTADADDSCVTIRGIPKYFGCPVPDSDHDGINDEEDSCKTIPGVERFNGCPIPDTDHDGINDDDDYCKTDSGSVKYHGCPITDTDKDGVNDEEDSCISVPGSAKYHGCPIPDRDHDGVNDELDKCPDQPGSKSNHGCPALDAAILQRAQSVAPHVTFGNNSNVLMKSSYPSLQELADIMKANPELTLKIEGHTDDTGKPEYNMTLSQERANSVKKALMTMGIAEDRLEAKGYGETQPITYNTTDAGKAKNRRVVFIFQLKNR